MGIMNSFLSERGSPGFIPTPWSCMMTVAKLINREAQRLSDTFLDALKNAAIEPGPLHQALVTELSKAAPSQITADGLATLKTLLIQLVGTLHDLNQQQPGCFESWLTLQANKKSPTLAALLKAFQGDTTIVQTHLQCLDDWTYLQHFASEKIPHRLKDWCKSKLDIFQPDLSKLLDKQLRQEQKIKNVLIRSSHNWCDLYQRLLNPWNMARFLFSHSQEFVSEYKRLWRKYNQDPNWLKEQAAFYYLKPLAQVAEAEIDVTHPGFKEYCKNAIWSEIHQQWNPEEIHAHHTMIKTFSRINRSEKDNICPESIQATRQWLYQTLVLPAPTGTPLPLAKLHLFFLCVALTSSFKHYQEWTGLRGSEEQRLQLVVELWLRAVQSNEQRIPQWLEDMLTAHLPKPLEKYLTAWESYCYDANIIHPEAFMRHFPELKSWTAQQRTILAMYLQLKAQLWLRNLWDILFDAFKDQGLEWPDVCRLSRSLQLLKDKKFKSDGLAKLAAILRQPVATPQEQSLFGQQWPILLRRALHRTSKFSRWYCLPADQRVKAQAIDLRAFTQDYQEQFRSFLTVLPPPRNDRRLGWRAIKTPWFQDGSGLGWGNQLLAVQQPSDYWTLYMGLPASEDYALCHSAPYALRCMAEPDVAIHVRLETVESDPQLYLAAIGRDVV